MPQQRITGIMDGKLTPIGAGPPVFSSADSKWSGFLLEGHVISASREEVGWSWHSTHVAVCTAGSCVVRISGAAGDAHYTARPGSICVFPKGCDHTTISLSDGGFQSVVVELDTTRLEQLLDDESLESRRALAPQINISDPQLGALVDSMRAEVEMGCPAGSLYGESLSLALTAYLSGRYSAKPPSTGVSGLRFSNAQMLRVLDFIHAHLASDFSLVELADLVQLSPRHFSRIFRNTFGATPYRYVMAERLNQAKALLATKRQSIVEIAESLGFANQSHFTDVFRRATGLPPRRFRAQC